MKFVILALMFLTIAVEKKPEKNKATPCTAPEAYHVFSVMSF